MTTPAGHCPRCDVLLDAVDVTLDTEIRDGRLSVAFDCPSCAVPLVAVAEFVLTDDQFEVRTHVERRTAEK